MRWLFKIPILGDLLSDSREEWQQGRRGISTMLLMMALLVLPFWCACFLAISPVWLLFRLLARLLWGGKPVGDE